MYMTTTILVSGSTSITLERTFRITMSRRTGAAGFHMKRAIMPVYRIILSLATDGHLMAPGRKESEGAAAITVSAALTVLAPSQGMVADSRMPRSICRTRAAITI